MSAHAPFVWVPFLHSDGVTVTIKKGWVRDEHDDGTSEVGIRCGSDSNSIIKQLTVPSIMLEPGTTDFDDFASTVGLPNAEYPAHLWPSASFLTSVTTSPEPTVVSTVVPTPSEPTVVRFRSVLSSSATCLQAGCLFLSSASTGLRDASALAFFAASVELSLLLACVLVFGLFPPRGFTSSVLPLVLT